MMTDYYQKNYAVYHEKTFFVDPSSFLEPLEKHLTPGRQNQAHLSSHNKEFVFEVGMSISGGPMVKTWTQTMPASKGYRSAG